MARDGGGGHHNTRDLRDDPKEHEPDNGGPGPLEGGGEGPQDGGPYRQQGEAATRLRVFITARRVRIDPAQKRRDYIRRLEALIQGLDRLIADPKVDENLKLKAMDVMIKVVRMCYLIVRDVDVEQMENELAELEAENRRAKEAAGRSDLGYEVEEDPAP